MKRSRERIKSATITFIIMMNDSNCGIVSAYATVIAICPGSDELWLPWWSGSKCGEWRETSQYI
jgi:hypothetical protein